LRPDEYAASIGISRRVVDGWMKKNVIPFSKIGRIILIDPVKANAAIDELERKAAQRVKVGGDL
jgi:hypothetical protein